MFGRGYGHDLVEDNGSSTADVVRFKAGLTASDLVWSSEGADVIISIDGSPNDQLTIKNQLQAGSNPDDRIESFVFADGSQLTLQDLPLLLAGGEAAPGVTIPGTAGNDTLNGTAGDDVIGGGRGNDTLNGQGGSNTYVYMVGDGSDVINEESTSSTQGTDRLHLLNLNSGAVELSRVGNALKVTMLASGHTITDTYQFASTTQPQGLDIIRFADGTEWDRVRIQAEAWYRGTDGADTIGGSSLNDTFFGKKGADTINTSTGSDTFIWRSGDGNDFINEESSSTSEIDVCDSPTSMPAASCCRTSATT
jgi:Ca2+-binding RTX toxin-like protein